MWLQRCFTIQLLQTPDVLSGLYIEKLGLKVFNHSLFTSTVFLSFSSLLSTILSPKIKTEVHSILSRCKKINIRGLGVGRHLFSDDAGVVIRGDIYNYWPVTTLAKLDQLEKKGPRCVVAALTQWIPWHLLDPCTEMLEECQTSVLCYCYFLGWNGQDTLFWQAWIFILYQLIG